MRRLGERGKRGGGGEKGREGREGGGGGQAEDGRRERDGGREGSRGRFRSAFIAPGGLPLLGMLFLGNLLRESLGADRLVKTAQNAFIDIVTILLGVTVGAKTSAATFQIGRASCRERV